MEFHGVTVHDNETLFPNKKQSFLISETNVDLVAYFYLSVSSFSIGSES